MKNVIIYSRVSTDEQAQHGYSLEDQQEKLPAFCQKQDFNVILNVTDNVSAKTFERKGWKTIMEYVKKNKNSVDTILVMRWNRFSRNITQALSMIQELKKYGVGINAVEQWIDFSIPQNKYMLNIYLTEAEVDNDMRSKLVKEGMRKANLEGRYLGPAPKGYANKQDGLKKPLLEKNEDAPFVLEAFEMMSTGVYSQRELLRHLNSKNFKIGKSQLSLLLQNRLYAGKVLVKALGDTPLQFVNGIHEQIISEELFFKVQDVLFGRNVKKNQRKTKQLDGNFPLRGFLQCSCCGGKMSASKSKGNGGTYYYYHCNDCNKRYKTDVLNMQLESMLDGIKFDSEAKELYMEVIKDCLKGSDSERKFEIKKKETEIDTNNKRLESLLDEKMDRNISQLDYESGKKRYEKNINTLLLEITDLKSIKTEFEAYLNWGFCMLQNVQKYYSISPISVKQKIIGSIYPEFMQIEDGEIKTTKVNEMVSLLSTINGTFGQKKTGQHLDKKELSRLVPGIGLEPIRSQ